ncbi:hypothetical protein REPUB_Repub13aG0008000 [Reevesia pubescens]
MELSSKHLKVSSSFFLVYVEVVILLSCFNLQCLNLLGLATPVVSGNDTDQQALLAFKAKITGDQLRVMQSWNSSIHFCQWYGVTCGRRHQRVTMLELQHLELVGSISPYIGNLSFLRVLNLEGNGFNNEIPQEIGRLRRLEILQLANNSISGEIPSNLSECSKLSFVHMRSNQLIGEIPGLLGLLSNLKVLRLTNNSLRGSIPPSLGNLSSLETLALPINQLSGVIPEALGKLKNLSFFSVASNAISGIVPVSIFNLSNIRTFDIGINKIQGTLPSYLGITMPHIEMFSITVNQITGQFPVSISNASNLTVLQVSNNELRGNLPSFEKLDKLSRFLIQANHFENGRASDLHFLCSLTNSTKLEYLSITQNNFGGVLPECISNLSSTILAFEVDQNKISGKIPAGIENLINLEVLWLSQNQLSGSIPSVIGRLWKLKWFYANDNNFLSGTIPSSIGNLTMLNILNLNSNNLQGYIPSSLGDCKNLVLLGLSNNSLRGSIPSELFGLSSLSNFLDLSSNYLTGVIPVEIGNLKNIGELYFSQNRLSGLLPNNLGSCVRLEKLFLDGNLFEGPIPLSLSSLRGLASLDISNNNLSGEIPEFLVSFGTLQYLNLSFNDFEGLIPSEGVFKNATATFVEGNNKLCGGIPELHLSRCNSKTSSKRSNISLKLKIAIPLVVLGVTFVFSFLLILWFRKEKEQPTTCAENSLLKLSYQSILRATDGFSSQNLVGSGSFGSVYKGFLEESGIVIGVKVLNLLNRGASRSFLAECEALKNIRHRNLVKVLTAISGVDYHGTDFKALVYEFMVNGSLEDWLHPSVGMNEQETIRNLNFLQRVNVAVDVAHALEYLHHHCETRIIHCDLKPSNVLLDGEMVGHISDFGLAKILSADRLKYSTNQSSSLGLRGTIGYAPPEYGIGSELSTKGDVYSYGILLLEMFTGKRPTNEMFKEGLSLHNFVVAALPKPKQVIEIIDPILLEERVGRGTIENITFNENGLGNDRHLQYLNSILEIGITCSAESPSERMDMSEVVTKLSFIRDKLNPTRLHREGKNLYAAQSAGNNVLLC